MKNPWTQQQVSQQKPSYGACYNILKQKYQLQVEKKEQFDYITIIKNANNIQHLKQKLAVQIIDSQFGDMVDPIKFETRIEQLKQLETIIENLLKCLQKCSTCVQHNNDTKNYIMNEGSIYINIPFQYKTQFFQLLRQALEKQEQLTDPDQIIIQQSKSVKELNEQWQVLYQNYSNVVELLDQIKQNQ